MCHIGIDVFFGTVSYKVHNTVRDGKRPQYAFNPYKCDNSDRAGYRAPMRQLFQSIAIHD